MDSITANYFALFEVINHSFGKSFNPLGADEGGREEKALWRSRSPAGGTLIEVLSLLAYPGGIGQAQQDLVTRSPRSLMAFFPLPLDFLFLKLFKEMSFLLNREMPFTSKGPA